MKRWIALLTLALTISAVAMTSGTGNSVYERALSAHRWQSEPAIAELRAAGQPGVDAFVASAANSVNQSKPEEVARFRAVLDRICRQRDCYASHLYWYTDLEQAKAAARTQGKAILSLRLLGNLDDDLSCANSRLFRTTLYANAQIAHVLHDHFVLHWSSERPVPKVTVDFGDGRKICSTVTGNSAHYLLDADGTPLDVLPGLYSPDAFLAQLFRLHAFANEYAHTNSSYRALVLRQYHGNLFEQVREKRAAEMSRNGVIPVAVTTPAQKLDDPAYGAARNTALPSTAGFGPVSAAAAARATTSKGAVEVRVLRDFGQLFDDVGGSDWKKMAAAGAGLVEFDARSLALMREKVPSFDARMLANLKRTVAEDTLRNEYDLHLRIHQWFANSPVPPAFVQLNKRVYAELFLTPASDPWLGLLEDNAFSAVAGGGVVTGSR